MKTFFITTSLLAAVAFAGVPRRTTGNDLLEERIVGGQNAPDGAFPYIVSLRYGSNHRCGAIIVHREWVVTAASCVAGWPAHSFSIIAGSIWLNMGGTKYSVIATYSHEKFDERTKQNNVAILRVKSIEFTSRIGSIALEKQEVGQGQQCTLSGWGYTSFPGSHPNRLQYIDLRTISNEVCRKANEIQAPVTDSQICTFTSTGQGSCIGDTGGPLVRTVGGTPKLIGIANWSVSPCASGKPDVYSRISSYYSWFQQKCQNCLS